MEEPHCSNVRIITAIFPGVRISRSFTVFQFSGDHSWHRGPSMTMNSCAVMRYKNINLMSHVMTKPTKWHVHPVKTQIVATGAKLRRSRFIDCIVHVI